ncbi:MAG: hypothetical protein K6E75_11460 [Lachnospiraceae bacterium]|nr:hypothetical protein [Lachnospiraceae bacterium]
MEFVGSKEVFDGVIRYVYDSPLYDIRITKEDGEITTVYLNGKTFLLPEIHCIVNGDKIEAYLQYQTTLIPDKYLQTFEDNFRNAKEWYLNAFLPEMEKIAKGLTD